VGHLFEGRFKPSWLIEKTFLFGLCRYVALNHVRAMR
jgi:hypothetical protein